MARAEKRVDGTFCRYVTLLTTLLLVISAPLKAQDQAAGDEPTTGDSAQALAAEPVQRVFVRSAADSGALAQQYPHLAVWLEPENAPRVLGLMERETTAKPAGAMVILAGEGQSANDGLIAGLRSRINKAGWAALSLGLTQPSPSLQRARERIEASTMSGEEREEAPASVMIEVNDQTAKDLVKAHREAIDGQLAAAVNWLSERGYQRVVLVGVGRGADEVRAFLSDAPAPVSGGVWIAADFGGQSPGDISSDSGGGKPVPLLDLYSSRLAAASERSAAFRRAGVTSYEAIAVPVPARPSARHAGVIANRLIGWADSE